MQPSLACINSRCQEVAFDPNTQNLAENMVDTKFLSVCEGWGILASDHLLKIAKVDGNHLLHRNATLYPIKTDNHLDLFLYYDERSTTKTKTMNY